MGTTLIRWIFAAGMVLLVTGCGAVVTPAVPDGGGGDAATDTSAPPTDTGNPVDVQDAGPGACRLPNGTFCPAGRSCPAGDGCNTCFCGRDGLAACTERACVDTGPGFCVLPNGTRCAEGATCPAGDGCNSCACRGGMLACTGVACVDAGPRFCTLPLGGRCALGATCPAGDGCNTCTCQPTGAAICTRRFCPPDAGPPDAGPDGCRLPDGGLCRFGETCPAGDGCNICQCTRTGLACTMRACPTDAGPGGCRMSDGRVCALGATCPAPDGCNICRCTREGLQCTTLGCVDAGPPVDAGVTCRTFTDCPRGQICLARAAGCGVPMTCAAPGCTADVAPFCGCDGRTFYGSSTCVTQSYVHRGPCEEPPPPPDGGVFDAGGPVDVPGTVRVCTTTADCPPDSVCEGMGCGPLGGRCEPLSRACTDDVAAYCGCDGRTFTASGSCPGGRYQYRGACR